MGVPAAAEGFRGHKRHTRYLHNGIQRHALLVSHLSYKLVLFMYACIYRSKHGLVAIDTNTKGVNKDEFCVYEFFLTPGWRVVV